MENIIKKIKKSKKAQLGCLGIILGILCIIGMLITLDKPINSQEFINIATNNDLKVEEYKSSNINSYMATSKELSYDSFNPNIRNGNYVVFSEFDSNKDAKKYFNDLITTAENMKDDDIEYIKMDGKHINYIDNSSHTEIKTILVGNTILDIFTFNEDSPTMKNKDMDKVKELKNFNELIKY